MFDWIYGVLEWLAPGPDEEPGTARILFVNVMGPVTCAVGLVYVMLTLPGLFAYAGHLPAMPPFAVTALDRASGVAGSWATAVDRISQGPTGTALLVLCFLALPTVWAASAVRSLRARSQAPLWTTVLASAFGLLIVPLVGWLSWIAVQVWHLIVRLVAWIHSWLPENFHLMVVWLVVLGGIFYAVFGWMFHMRWMVWVGLTVAVVFAVLLVAFPQVVVWLLLLGVALFLLGWALRVTRWFGVLLLGPFFSAAGAGVRRGECVDVAVAVGTSLSLIVVSGTLDPGFHAVYESAWSATPLLGVLPAPTLPLFPEFLAEAMAPALAGFVVVADGLVLVLLATVAVLSLTLHPGEWDDEDFVGMLLPALGGLAGAVFGVTAGSLESDRGGSDGGSW